MDVENEVDGVYGKQLAFPVRIKKKVVKDEGLLFYILTLIGIHESSAIQSVGNFRLVRFFSTRNHNFFQLSVWFRLLLNRTN